MRSLIKELKIVKRYLTYFYCAVSAFILMICFSASSKGVIKHTLNSSYTIKTVVIDAGHGGHDAGCSGKHSKEKHITLKVAKQLKNYIKDAFPDVQIILTRETDVFVPLHHRSAIANKNNADLFISIHCNAAPHSSSVKGTETYVMGLHKTESNLSVAKRENSVILEETDYANHYDGFDPNSPMAHITFSLFQNAYQEQSIVFADLIEKQFSQRAGRKSRGVKQAGFLVLYKTAMPSVLVESGFLTNQSEEDFLKSTYGQEIISSAIYRAFKEYKVLVEEKGSIGFIDEPIMQEKKEVEIQTEIYPPKEKIVVPVEQDVEISPHTNLPPSESQEIIATPSIPKVTVTEPQITDSQEKELSFIEAYLNKHAKFVKEVSPTEKNPTKRNSDVISPNNYDSFLSEDALVYKVQIFLSSNDALLNSTDLNNIVALEIESLDNGLKRYLSGRFSDYDSVQKHCAQLRINGFPDAFIVKYQGGARVP